MSFEMIKIEELQKRLDRVESTLHSLAKYYSCHITGNDVNDALKEAKK